MNIDHVLYAHGVLGGVKDDVPPPPITNFNSNAISTSEIELTWTNPDYGDLQGILVKRKEGSYPSSVDDGTTIFNSSGNSVIDSSVNAGVTYYYRAFPYDSYGNYNYDTGQQATGLVGDDLSGAPGPIMIAQGGQQAGYYGEVPSSELIDGDTLASNIGLTGGSPQHSNAGWLKFAYQGKVQFVAKKTLRYSIEWDEIALVGAVYGDGSSEGDAKITINDILYKVRLLRMHTNDPLNYGASDKDAIGSEWNLLMHPIHVNASNGGWNYPEYVGSPPDWGVGYNDSDLLTHDDYGNGSHAWGQETRDDSTGQRAANGLLGVSYVGPRSSGSSLDYIGWRPVLEVVE